MGPKRKFSIFCSKLLHFPFFFAKNKQMYYTQKKELKAHRLRANFTSGGTTQAQTTARGETLDNRHHQSHIFQITNIENMDELNKDIGSAELLKGLQTAGQPSSIDTRAGTTQLASNV